MPTTRPDAGTFAANLNASHPIVSNALGLWVVDADDDVPDLKGTQPDATQGTLTYATTGALGGHFTGPGAGGGTAAVSTPLAVPIASYPIVVGVTFLRAGSKSGASGIECLFSLGDASSPTGIFAGIFIDDGTVATAGDVIFRIRANAGDNIALGNLGTYVADAVNTATFAIYDSSGRQLAGWLNGSKIFDAAAVDDPHAFGTDTLGYATGLAMDRAGSIANECSTSTQVAAWWYSQTQLTDQDYIDWTADPWSITGAGVATSNYYLGADVTPGNWTTSTGSGTLASMVSETTRDDTQYIQSALNPSTDLVELEWANVQIPSVNTDHTVSYVLKGDASCQALVALLAGDATTVTAWVHTALPPTFQRFDQELSTAAADAWSVGGYAGSHLTVTAG